MFAELSSNQFAAVVLGAALVVSGMVAVLIRKLTASDDMEARLEAFHARLLELEFPDGPIGAENSAPVEPSVPYIDDSLIGNMAYFSDSPPPPPEPTPRVVIEPGFDSRKHVMFSRIPPRQRPESARDAISERARVNFGVNHSPGFAFDDDTE